MELESSVLEGLHGGLGAGVAMAVEWAALHQEVTGSRTVCAAIERMGMSTSTDAIIAFGFDLGEEEDLPEQISELLKEHAHETDECLAADHGIELPQYAVGCDYKEYSAGRKSALARLKIDLIPHCSNDYTMYFLAVRGSDKKANRGSPTALDAYDLDAGKFGQEAIDAMRAFCERHSIEWQEPKWHIFSMWD